MYHENQSDFVTNSSSSSFVLYTITPGEDASAEVLEKFDEFWHFINELEQKYECGCMEWDGDTLEVRLWTPGLSENYFMSDDTEDDDEAEMLARFPEDECPPPVEVAIAVCFGNSGSDESYLSELTDSDELLAEDGTINNHIETSLTNEEAARLCEFIELFEVSEREFIGNVD